MKRVYKQDVTEIFVSGFVEFFFCLDFCFNGCYDLDLIRHIMSKSSDQFDSSDCVCSFGMKLTWDINDPKLPQVKATPLYCNFRVMFSCTRSYRLYAVC